MKLIKTNTDEINAKLSVHNEMEHSGCHQYKTLKVSFPNSGRDDVLAILEEYIDCNDINNCKTVGKVVLENCIIK